jgi:hypothetical protein
MSDDDIRRIVRNAIDNADSRVLNNLLTLLASVSRNRLKDEQFAKQLLSMRIDNSQSEGFGCHTGTYRRRRNG